MHFVVIKPNHITLLTAVMYVFISGHGLSNLIWPCHAMSPWVAVVGVIICFENIKAARPFLNAK